MPRIIHSVVLIAADDFGVLGPAFPLIAGANDHAVQRGIRMGQAGVPAHGFTERNQHFSIPAPQNGRPGRVSVRVPKNDSVPEDPRVGLDFRRSRRPQGGRFRRCRQGADTRRQRSKDGQAFRELPTGEILPGHGSLRVRSNLSLKLQHPRYRRKPELSLSLALTRHSTRKHTTLEEFAPELVECA